MKPRVLHVHKYYAPYVGGMERVVQDICEGLRDDYDFRVLVCGKRTSREIRNGVCVLRAAMPAVALSMPLSLQFYPFLRSESREADLLHFHPPFPLAESAALLDGLEGKRIVATYHHDVVRQRWLNPVYGPVLRSFLRRCERVIVSSERLRDRSPALSEVREKCVVVPFGFSAERTTEPMELPEKFVLFVGRLVPYKGAEVLLRSMREFDAPVVFVGEGPLGKSLRALAEQLGVADRAMFVGRLSGPRLRYCFSKCRMFVLPSVMTTEAFGIVQVEAMSWGKAVVNTDLPTGVPEVSRHEETGLTVPPRDPASLGAAIRSLLADDGRRARYEANAEKRAAQFTMKAFLDGMRAVYREVMRQN